MHGRELGVFVRVEKRGAREGRDRGEDVKLGKRRDFSVKAKTRSAWGSQWVLERGRE